MLKRWEITAWDRKGHSLIEYEFFSYIPFWMMRFIVRLCKVEVSYYSGIKLITLTQDGLKFKKEIDIYRHPAFKD